MKKLGGRNPYATELSPGLPIGRKSGPGYLNLLLSFSTTHERSASSPSRYLPDELLEAAERSSMFEWLQSLAGGSLRELNGRS